MRTRKEKVASHKDQRKLTVLHKFAFRISLRLIFTLQISGFADDKEEVLTCPNIYAYVSF